MDSTDEGLPFEDIDPQAAALFATTATDAVLRKWMREPCAAKVILTDENVRAALPGAKESWIRDADCPGLRLRIRPTGSKSYYLERSDIRDAGSRRVFLGEASDFTVAQMRTKVKWLTTGLYVSKPRRIKYRRDMRIIEVFEKYFQEYHPHSAWFKTAKVLFYNHIAPKYGHYFLSGIHKERWLTLIESVTLEQPSRGSNLHKALRSFLNWAVQRGLLQANPLSRTRVEIPTFDGPPKPKALSVKQLLDIYRAAQILGEPWSAMVGFLILTGEAMDHVRHLENRSIDWNQNLWTLERRVAPEWTVQLSPEAVELLMPYRNQKGYFFRSPRSALPINFYTEIVEQLRAKTLVPWNWGIRDIRFAVRQEIVRLGGDSEGILLWSKNFVAIRDWKAEDEVTL